MPADVVVDADADPYLVTTTKGRVEGVVEIISVLRRGGISIMTAIVKITSVLTRDGSPVMTTVEGKVIICYPANTFSIASRNSNIEDSMVVEGISSRLEKLDNAKIVEQFRTVTCPNSTLHHQIPHPLDPSQFQWNE